MMKDQVMFKPVDPEAYTQTFKERQLIKLKRQAKTLGLQLLPI
jgi:hypothetical protein